MTTSDAAERQAQQQREQQQQARRERAQSRADIVAQYDRIAPFIDVGYALTFPHRARLMREHVVPALGLSSGSGARVLDLCCGAGHNLRFLVDAVGAGGRVTGVDISGKMLDVAAARVAGARWQNVRLVRGDAADLASLVKPDLDAALVSFALALLPDRVAVLQALRRALKPGGRVVFIEHEPFAGAARIFNPLMWALMNAIPVNVDAIFDGAARLRAALPDVFPDVTITWHYARGIWVARATAPAA